MRFDIITIFPSIFDSFLAESLLAKARTKKIVDIHVHDLRSWTTDKHRTVDDKPYGGGPGMILKIEPLVKAIEAIKKQGGKRYHHTKIILLTPGGKQFSQKKATQFSKLDRIILLCGRYEGFDARISNYVDEEVSIGPYVLSGGEVPAMVVIEAVGRLVPGFIGKPESLFEESFNPSLTPDPLSLTPYVEYPQYTRPAVFRRQRVPKILLSGNHQQIIRWRKESIKKSQGR